MEMYILSINSQAWSHEPWKCPGLHLKTTVLILERPIMSTVMALKGYTVTPTRQTAHSTVPGP